MTRPLPSSPFPTPNPSSSQRLPPPQDATLISSHLGEIYTHIYLRKLRTSESLARAKETLPTPTPKTYFFLKQVDGQRREDEEKKTGGIESWKGSIGVEKSERQIGLQREKETQRDRKEGHHSQAGSALHFQPWSEVRERQGHSKVWHSVTARFDWSRREKEEQNVSVPLSRVYGFLQPATGMARPCPSSSLTSARWSHPQIHKH